MKSIFKSKKGLGLLGATFMVIAGCTSDDVNYDIPVNSNDLIDQNVVYKSETVAVEVEQKPQINSTDIATGDEKPDANTTSAGASVVIVNTEATDLTNSENKEADVVVDEKASETEIDVSSEVAKAKTEAEANAKLMNDEKTTDVVDVETKVIVPPPAYSDNTVNFTKGSYTEKVSADDEFARAVAEAEARRSGRPVESEKVLTRAEKLKMVENGFAQSKQIADSAVETTQKIRDNHRKSYKLDVRDVPSENRERNITFLSTVIYHSNAKADISARDERTLKNVANFAKENDAILRVVGNSSSRSKNMKESQNKIANFDLSILRAQKVRDLLVKYGVPSDKVFISAVSDTEKISEENMPINEAVNRRTEVYINY